MTFAINGYTFRVTTRDTVEVRVCDIVETFTSHRAAIAWINAMGAAL